MQIEPNEEIYFSLKPKPPLNYSFAEKIKLSILLIASPFCIYLILYGRRLNEIQIRNLGILFLSICISRLIYLLIIKRIKLKLAAYIFTDKNIYIAYRSKFFQNKKIPLNYFHELYIISLSDDKINIGFGRPKQLYQRSKYSLATDHYAIENIENNPKVIEYFKKFGKEVKVKSYQNKFR